MWKLGRLLRKTPTRSSAPSGEAAGKDPKSGGPVMRSPVIVGLGNPGRSYERTRHNVGFLVADELARRHGGDWRKKKRSMATPVNIGALPATLLKPQTFMNNSGQAVGGHRVGDLVVVHDDLDLPEGAVRVKAGGGAGGHNGLRSIIGQLGNDFVRVRVGVGRPPAGMTVTDYVLGKMNATVRDAVPVAADAVEAAVEQGPEAAMNRFNTRS
ncbi:MAG: aminoacyl-tRNA hydrolase [Rubrobacteraceae bacterium]